MQFRKTAVLKLSLEIFIHSTPANTMEKNQTNQKERNYFLNVWDVYRLPAKNRRPIL